MDRKLRFAVIGTGAIARVNAEALLKTGRADIRALCNRTPEKAAALNRALGLDAPIYTDHRQLLAGSDIDAAILCTPQDAHAQAFADCARAGVSVLVEKPLALNAAQGEDMLAARDRYGIRAAVCHTQRYRAPMIALKRLIESGELGEVVSALDVIDMRYFTETRPAWCFDRSRAGGAILLTHGAHQVDRLAYLLGGEVAWVDAVIERTDAFLPDAGADGLDVGYHLLGQAGGRAFVADCGGFAMPILSGVMVRFTRGTARMCLKDTGVDRTGLFMSRGGASYEELPLPCPDGDTYLRQMNDLLDALQGRANAAPTLEHALHVMRVLDAAVRADAEGARVAVQAVGKEETP